MINKIMNLSMILLLFTGLVSCEQKVSEYATIEGVLEQVPKGVEKISINEVVDGDQKELASVQLDKEGRFGFHFKVENPGFYYIDFGQMDKRMKKNMPWVRLYLERGMNLNLEIGEEDYTVGGEGQDKNQVVHQANVLYTQFQGFNKLGGVLTYKEFFPFLDETGIPTHEMLMEELNEGEGPFYELMKVAVRADFEESVLSFMFLPRVAHPKKGEHHPVYQKIVVNGVKFEDPQLLRLGNGIDYMRNYLLYKEINGTDERPKSEGIYQRQVKQIGNDTLKEVYLRSQLANAKFKSGEYERVVGPLKKYLTSEKSKKILFELEKQLHKDAGQAGFDFAYKDTEENTVAFSDLRGKYVYMDLWATWCSPCKAQIPYLKELEKDLEHEDIVFLSVSLDKPADRQKWKDFVKKENLGGIQLMADMAFESDIAENYEINAIPRFMIFDKEGKIVSTDAMRPSSPELKDYLQDLLKSS